MLAQQNAVNSPYVFPANANFNAQTSQGGAVFLPDGSALLAAYNIVPTSVPAANTNASQMTVNAPDTMLIQLGIKLQENLGGKMVITSDGATAYAISQSGFMVLPIGTLRNQPLAMPDSTVALLASDQCGVTAALNSATIPVRDIGGGRITVTVQALTAATTAATVRATARTYGARCHRAIQCRGGAHARYGGRRPVADPGHRSRQHYSRRARLPKHPQCRIQGHHSAHRLGRQHHGPGRHARRHGAPADLYRQSGAESPGSIRHAEARSF